MINKVEIKTGNQEVIWCHDGADYVNRNADPENGDNDPEIIGVVSAVEISANPERAWEVYAGDDGIDYEEIDSFCFFLQEHGYKKLIIKAVRDWAERTCLENGSLRRKEI